MQFRIQNKWIGNDYPLFFIAEAGVNHNGSIKIGKKLIDIAAEAGADAVKFQTFKAGELNTKQAPKSTYHIETTGDDLEQSWYELLKSQEISKEMHLELINYCNEKNIIFLSTPYGFESADLLEELNIAAFKVASTDTNNTPLLNFIAKKGKPIILSTAMCEFEEVKKAVKSIRSQGLNDIAVLQCTGNYPTEISNSNLNVIQTYRKKLKSIVGFSDHTKEMINPVAATALGAKIYEKHFTVDKSMPGPDHRMSLSPKELKKTIAIIRQTEEALGTFQKQVLDSEVENRLKLRKSVVAVKDIPKGTMITNDMIGIKRPGNGIEPSFFQKIIGSTALVYIESDSIIEFDELEIKNNR